MQSNRIRMTLTILAVVWGTFSIASMLAVGEGIRLTFGSAIKTLGTGSLIVSGNQTSKAFKGNPGGQKIIFTTGDFDELQRSLAGKAIVTGETYWSATLRNGKNVWTEPPLTPVSLNYKEIHGVRLKPEGRFINDIDFNRSRQVVVLGSKTAEKLFKDEDPLGKFIFIGDTPFLVIGIQNPTLRFIETHQVPDDYTNWIPFSTYQRLTQSKQYLHFIIAPVNLKELPQIQNEILNVIAKRRNLNPEDLSILNFMNLEEEKLKFTLAFLGIEGLLVLAGALTLIVAGVGITNVMYISVRQSTRAIGIQMALGATPSHILIHYIKEAILATAFGGMIGLLLTFIFLKMVNQIHMDSALLQYFGSPRPILSFPAIITVVIILGLIGLFAGIFPARRAATINPAEALRYE